MSIYNPITSNASYATQGYVNNQITGVSNQILAKYDKVGGIVSGNITSNSITHI